MSEQPASKPSTNAAAAALILPPRCQQPSRQSLAAGARGRGGRNPVRSMRSVTGSVVEVQAGPSPSVGAANRGQREGVARTGGRVGNGGRGGNRGRHRSEIGVD